MDIYNIHQERPITIKGSVLRTSLGECTFTRDIREDVCQVEIWIKNGFIQNIKPLSEGEENVLSKEGVRINIPQGQIIVPAFVDCHVHLVLDGIHGFRKFTGPVWDEALALRLKAILLSGVAAVRDGSDRYNTAMQAKQLCQREVSNGSLPIKGQGVNNHSGSYFPNVITTGWAIHRDGHYGSFLGQGGIKEIREVRDRIRQLKEAGVDQLKVAQSGLVSFTAYGKTGPAQFTLPEMKEIVRTAGEYNLPVMVHASSDEAVRIAVEAGAHTVEHGYFVSPQTLELMAEKGVAWVPTVAPVAAALKEAETPGCQQARVNPEVLKKTIENHLGKIQLAHRTGVLLGVGTDAGSPGVGWENGYWQEMKYYAEAGLSTEDILGMASKNGAEILGLCNKMGTIEVGKKPYFLSINIESLKNMENFQGPLSIFHAVS